MDLEADDTVRDRTRGLTGVTAAGFLFISLKCKGNRVSFFWLFITFFFLLVIVLSSRGMLENLLQVDSIFQTGNGFLRKQNDSDVCM